MSKFQESLSRFSITAEIPPPKGANVSQFLRIAEKVANRIDGANVTDNQRGMMRMSSLVFCKFLKDVGCEPIWQVACRDRNRLALQSDMLGAMAFGIENVCLMTGDFTTMGDNPDARPVYDLDSVQLIKAANDLARGVAMNGKTVKDVRPFFTGGVINPFYEPFELELLKTKKKISAGAKFFQTQPFFDIPSVEKFLGAVKGLDAAFLIGVTPLKGEKMITFLNEKVLTTPIPADVTARITGAADPAREGLLTAAEFVNALRKIARGVHLMPIGQEENLPLLLDMIEAGK